MKRVIKLGFLVLSLSFFFISSVYAFNIGGAAKGAAKGAANQAAAGEINKKLSGESAKCKYATKTTIEVSGCNLDKIFQMLGEYNRAAEKSGFAKDVDIEVTAYGQNTNIARDRAYWVRDKVRAGTGVSYWDYDTYYKVGADSLLIQVKQN